MQIQQIRSASLKPGRPKILVIEDDRELSGIMQEFFEVTDFNYYITGPVCDILPVIGEYKPSLVILDYLMAQINGGELCRQIKNNADTEKLPVLIYSAYPKEMCFLDDNHCDAFIAKPFDLDDLQKVVEKLTRV